MSYNVHVSVENSKKEEKKKNTEKSNFTLSARDNKNFPHLDL